MSATFTPHLPAGPQGRWVSTLKLLRKPRETFVGWVEKYGDPLLVPALNGPIVLTGRSDLIRQIFGADPNLFAAFAVDTLRPMLGDGSLLLMDGARHRQERKLVMPMFHGDRMKAYGETMQQVAVRQFDQVLQTCERNNNPRFAGISATTSISLEVIVRAVFGAPEAKRVEHFLTIAREAVRRSSPLLFFSKRMQFSFFGISPWDRFVKAQQELHAAFNEELARLKTRDQPGDDIFSLLANAHYEDGSPITPEHLRDQLFTFLFAGHETTAIALAWALYHIHRNPEVLTRLHQELDQAPDDSPATLVSLPYLKAVVQETLRLYPIVTEVLRLLKEPMELGEYRVPAGHAVAAAAVLAHYQPDVYPEPELFKPERFLQRSFSPFEYMPFGGGHRRCVGAAFSTYEMQIVLGTICKRYRMEAVDESVVPVRRNVTMGPSTGINLRMLGRRS